MYMDPRQLSNAGALGAPIYASTGEGGGSYIAGYEPVAEGTRDPYFNLDAQGNYTKDPGARNVFYDSSTGQFVVTQGDMDSGGIQRWNVNQQGVQDMGFEAPRSFGDQLRSAARNAAPYLAGMAGLGVGAAYLPALLGGGGAAGGAAASTGAAGGGLGGVTFGAGLESMPTFLGSGAGGAMGSAGTMAGGIDAAALLGGTGGFASGAGGLAGTAAGAFGAVPGLGEALGGAAPAGGGSWADILRQGGNALTGGGGLGGLGALGAAGLGALAGVAGNGDITSTQNTSGTSSTSGSNSQSLAPWLQGYAQDYVSRAQQLANAPTTNASLDIAGGLLSQYATQGDSLVNQARAQQANVIGGGLLGGNPYLDQVAGNIGRRMGDAYATGTRAGVFSGYNNDGNSVQAKSGFGQALGMQDRNYADALGSTMSNLYMGNYNTERAAQDAASRGSLGFGTFGVNNATNLAGFGADQFQRPFMANQAYGNAINPAFGSTSNSNATGTTNNTQTQNVTAPNSWMAGLGGAAAGAGIYRNIFGGR
jgi:hypothetical protein